MRRRLTALALLLALLCGCAPQTRPPAEEAPDLPAGDLALAALSAAGQEASGLERLDETLDDDALDAWLRDFYGLDPEDMEDCAVYRAGGTEILEAAVFRFREEAGETDLEGLEAYIDARRGDFTGYAPDQAAIADQARAVCRGRYAALLLCGNAPAAEEAFLACLEGGTVPQVTETPEETPVPKTTGEMDDPEVSTETPEVPDPPKPPETPEETPPETVPPEETAWPATYPGRTPYTPPEDEDMTLYDTAPILAAWTSGDHSGLSEKDAAILDLAGRVLEETVTSDMDDLEKERAIYQWVTANVTYDDDHYDPLAQTDRDSYTPYGPLKNGRGVCLGFASVFQLLLEMSSIESQVVVGAAYESRESHAWVLVRLDGVWHGTDPTWDVHALPALWRYFNVSSDFLARTDHQWDYGRVPEAAALG